jgi:hypothetical protein
VADQVVIERRFRGPPNSGQGGYSCGLVAEHIDAPSAAVSLRLPPPLERELHFEHGDDANVALLDGDALVAEGAPVDLALDAPDPVPLEQARTASAANRWLDRHPFPGCFGCGPQRSQDEAVAITVGPLDASDLFAGPWTPLAEFADEGGAVAKRFVWAALDCPTAVPAVPLEAPASVLGRLTGRLIAPIEPERPHTVVAWLIGHDGRKHRGGVAIHAPDGQLCAYAEGLWIELRDPSAMGAKA